MYYGLASYLALLILFGFIVFFILGFSQRSFLYFPSKEPINISNYDYTGMKEVELTTSDGLVLKSWFKKPNAQEGYTILIFHGNAGHIGDRVEKFKRFIASGHGLLFLEYRGYGGNPGKPTEKGLYNDALAALKFLSKQYIFSDKIILYGESLGCGIAAKLSSENAFAATILESPYTSIADVAQRHYWYLPAKWIVLDRYEILAIINNIKSPLMVIHGEKDNVISIEFGKKVFDAAPEPKEALFVPNASHNNLFEFNVDEKILGFLEKRGIYGSKYQ